MTTVKMNKPQLKLEQRLSKYVQGIEEIPAHRYSEILGLVEYLEKLDRSIDSQQRKKEQIINYLSEIKVVLD